MATRAEYPHPDADERRKLRASIKAVLAATAAEPHERDGQTTTAGHIVRLALVVDELVAAEAAEAGRDKRNA